MGFMLSYYYQFGKRLITIHVAQEKYLIMGGDNHLGEQQREANAYRKKRIKGEF